MVKPNEKQKKIIKIAGITGAVYLIFRYILPLMVPFLVAGIMALMLYPSASVIACHAKFRFGRKTIRLSVSVVGICELLLVLATLGIWLWIGGYRLYEQGKLLLTHIPSWLEYLDVWITGICYRMEAVFDLKAGSLVYLATDMLKGLISKTKDGIMPYLMSHSMVLCRGFSDGIIFGIITLLAVALFLNEMPHIRTWCKTSVFREEISLINKRLSLTGKAYMKTQGLILLITTSICIASLFLMENPYFIIAGMVIGLMDSLPILGTGLVFIPWMLISLFNHQWKQFCLLLITYLLCYYLRQFLEAKLIGKQGGLSPLTTLMSLFVGLKLFGLAGVILGPIGLMLIRDFADHSVSKESDDT